MTCARCGAKMDPKQRYCMKCGAINYEHPDNQSMKKYITEKEIVKSNEEYIKNKEEKEVNKIYVGGKLVDEKLISPKQKTNSKKSLIFIIIIVILIIIILYIISKNFLIK